MTAHFDGSYDRPRNILGEYARPSRPGAAPRHSERLLHGHLVDNGFCPALAQYPLASFDYVTVYYVSLLRRRRSPGPDHGSCSSNVCEANHVDLDHYQTKYVHQHCTCKFSPVLDGKIEGIHLISIISDNAVPIIPAIEATATSPNVAFSHVWSDGLGNRTANSLLRC